MGEFEVTELFQYIPLADALNEIRIVHLKADRASTAYGSLPQCTLTVAQANPSDAEHRWAHAGYSALSYTWGDTQDLAPIIIDGKYKKVTSNLAAFLNHATQLVRKANVDSLPFWCDAISINQDDDAEKSEQVRCMGSIFNDADRVVIWVGEADADTHLAFNFLQNLSRDYDSANDVLRTYAGAQSSNSAQQWLSYIDKHYNETIVALRALVKRPWWSRIWIQQEVAKAPIDRTDIVCGSAWLPWLDVVRGEIALQHLFKDSTQSSNSSGELSETRIFQLANEIIIMVQKMVRVCQSSYYQIWPDAPQYRYTLLHRLILNSIDRVLRVQATLRVDYIYAMLGISSDFEQTLTKDDIDYSKPWEQVYVKYTKHMLRQDRGLLLGFADINHPQSLPSWVPDWSSPMQRLSLCWRQDVFGPETSPELYSAGGASSLFWCGFQESSSNPRGLIMKGFEIDRVTSAGLARDLFPHLSRDDAVGHWIRDWMVSYEAFQQRILRDTLGQFERDLWRIPIADQDIDDVKDIAVRAPESISADYQDLRDKFIKNEQIVLASNTGKYERTMDIVVWNRMPFLSDDNRLGIGPSTMLPGDRVFLILGCQTPFVLRMTEAGHYRVVGEVYLQGVMDGELMTDNPTFEELVIV